MENELRSHLLTCASAFAAARGIEKATVGRLAANDWGFFERIADPSKAFTARTYDKVMDWFSANWPGDASWPDEVPRPEIGPDASDVEGPAGEIPDLSDPPFLPPARVASE